jgi:hypothetical protein
MDERENDNPFAIITLAHLKALETRHSRSARYKAKREIVILLRDRDYLREDVKALLCFIDWELHLPEDMDIKFWDMIRIRREIPWERM